VSTISAPAKKQQTLAECREGKSRLAERSQALEQGALAPAREFFSDDERCQGSDAEESSSSN